MRFGAVFDAEYCGIGSAVDCIDHDRNQAEIRSSFLSPPYGIKWQIEAVFSGLVHGFWFSW